MEDNNKPGSFSKRDDDDDDEIYRMVMTCDKEYVYNRMKRLRDENSFLRKKLEIIGRTATQQENHIRDFEKLIRIFEQEIFKIGTDIESKRILEITSRIATLQGNHIRKLEKLIRVFEQGIFKIGVDNEDNKILEITSRIANQQGNHIKDLEKQIRDLEKEAAYAAYLNSVRSAFHTRQSIIFSEKAVSILSMVTSPLTKKQINTSSEDLYDDPKPSTSSDIDSSFCFQSDDSLNDDKQKESTPGGIDNGPDDNRRQGKLQSCSNGTSFADNESQKPSSSTDTGFNDNKRQSDSLSNSTFDDIRRQEELSHSTETSFADKESQKPSSSTDTSFNDNRRQSDLLSNSTFDDIRRQEELSHSTDTSVDNNRTKSSLDDKRRLRELACSTKNICNDNARQRPMRKSTCSSNCTSDDNRRQKEPQSGSIHCRFNDAKKKRKSSFRCGRRPDESKEKEKKKLSSQTAYKASVITVSSSRNNACHSNGNESCKVLEKIHFNIHLPDNPFQCGTPTIVTPSANFPFFKRRDYFKNLQKKWFKSSIRGKTENSKLNFDNCKSSRNTFRTNRKVNNSLKKKSKLNAMRNKVKINEEALKNSAKELSMRTKKKKSIRNAGRKDSMRTKKKKSIRNAGRKDVHDAVMVKKNFGDEEENHVQSFKVTDIENDENMQPKVMLIDIFSDPNAANDPYVSKIKQDLGWILDESECPVVNDDMEKEELTFSNLGSFDGTNESPDIDNEKVTAESVYSFSEENMDYQDPSESEMLSPESVHNSDQCLEKDDEKFEDKSPNEVLSPNEVANEFLSEDSATIFMDEPCCSKDSQSFSCSPAPENPPRKGPRTPPHPPPDYSDEEDVYDYGTDYYYESED
ncbi:uncharacterized protein LOC118199705 isoform X2 [Stegodyphus dumicola]|uniref:uncharacterized protein LOC118199705 isoform X2 n=1 Tax=Stegodyphus dumicola TaxID=202533 RepID=UPI0015B22076|nr:uncharacterized protein LOC118199705 isoform X2 [Stegodyphus dumicola]